MISRKSRSREENLVGGGTSHRPGQTPWFRCGPSSNTKSPSVTTKIITDQGKKMFGTSDTIQVTVLYPGSSYGAVAEFLLLRATESQTTSTEHGRRSAESREPVVRNGLHCLKRAR